MITKQVTITKATEDGVVTSHLIFICPTDFINEKFITDLIDEEWKKYKGNNDHNDYLCWFVDRLVSTGYFVEANNDVPVTIDVH